MDFSQIRNQSSIGASGQVRLMYLVNADKYIIKLVWVYNHEQYEKRPAEKDLKNVIQEILENTEDT